MQFNRVNTIEEAQELIRIMPSVIAMDTEYVKGDPRFTQLLSVIIADDERAWAVDPSLLPMLTPTIKTRKIIFLQDYNHCDTIILLKNGCDIRGTNTHNLIDMHHLIDENGDHSLETRCQDSFQDSYKKGFWGKYKNFEDAPEDEALEYQCKDGIYTYRLGLKDLHIIDHPETGLYSLYSHVKKLSKALLETELNGIRVNVNLMTKTKIEMQDQIEGLLPKLRELFDAQCTTWEFQEWEKQINKRKSESGKLSVERPKFSFTSDKQIAWLVYEALKCPIVNKTKTGNPKTDFETLQLLSNDYPDLQLLVHYKDVKSLYSTFVEGMLERVKGDRIYPSFNVSGTVTGRLSHSNPNMGNLPKTGVVRNFFIPDEGMVFIGADYSQLEVVIEANLTNDSQLLKIVNEGVSKHDITSEGLGIDRNSAKTLNFALQYGAGVGKVAKILQVSKERAEDIYRRYWELYSGVYALKEKVNKEIQECGQITNLAGRTRHFPKVTNKYEIFSQQRQAYNFLIQGVAAEVCNRAFCRFDGLFTVHDEIVAQCRPEEVIDEMAGLVKIMEASSKEFNFKYPLKAVAYGPLTMWAKT